MVPPTPVSTSTTSSLRPSDSDTSIKSMASDSIIDNQPRPQRSKSQEDETKTSDAPTDAIMTRRRSLPVEDTNAPAGAERATTVPPSLSAPSSTVSLVAAAAAAPSPSHDNKPAAHHYTGDTPIHEEFDAAQMNHRRLSQLLPPLPPPPARPVVSLQHRLPLLLHWLPEAGICDQWLNGIVTPVPYCRCTSPQTAVHCTAETVTGWCCSGR